MAPLDKLQAAWPAKILIADDEAAVRTLLRRILESAGYQVVAAGTGQEAISLAGTEHPDLFILDISMPDQDGVEICRQIKGDPGTHLTPVIHVTGQTQRDDRLRALEAGSDEFVAKPFDVEELLVRVRSLLRTKLLTDHLVSDEAVLVALSRTVEARDHYTERHLHRVAGHSVSVARMLGMSERDVESIRLGGLLHDLGKIAVPDRILHKPAALGRAEFAMVKVHPEVGAEIVRPLRPFDGPEPAVLHHHERFDGRGYPYGLRGTDIPLPARIVAVADSFDAMTTNRSYRTAMSAGDAMQRLRDGRGEQWDPEVVEAFLLQNLGSGDVQEVVEGL
jgi:cyclic di-GMP phosphodiesterase